MTEAPITRTRAVIADDEPLARQRLRMLLAEEPWIDLVAECVDAPAAIAAIERFRPGLVFLDVQMPGGSGFDVIEAIGADRMPFVIFVTAFDRYALRAFDVHAVHPTKAALIKRSAVRFDRAKLRHFYREFGQSCCRHDHGVRRDRAVPALRETWIVHIRVVRTHQVFVPGFVFVGGQVVLIFNGGTHGRMRGGDS